MSQYVQTGNYLNYTPVAAVSAGEPVVCGDRVFVAPLDIAAATPGALATCGVWLIPKVLIESYVLGQKLYWDDTAKMVTSTPATNKVMGYAAADAASGGLQMCQVLLGS